MVEGTAGLGLFSRCRCALWGSERAPGPAPTRWGRIGPGARAKPYGAAHTQGEYALVKGVLARALAVGYSKAPQGSAGSE